MYQVIAADDEPMMRKGLRVLVDWAALGCVLTAVFEDGQALLEALPTLQPDIVICDIKMPRKDGIAVAKELFEHKNHAKVILLTAYADFSYAQKAIQYEVSDYVTKSGSLDGISTAVKKCCNALDRSSKKPVSTGEEGLQLFFRAILDGSLYDPQEARTQCESLGIYMDTFVLCVAEMLLDETTQEGEAARLTESVGRLLTELGGKRRCYLLPMGRGRLYAVLPGPNAPGFLGRCKELTDTFSALTGKELFLGLSTACQGALALPTALEQARAGLEVRFLNRSAAVFPYSGPGISTAPAEHTQALARVLGAVESGNAAAASEALVHLFCLQEESACSPQMILRSGQSLWENVRAILARWEQEDTSETGQKLRTCLFFEDYKALLSAFTEDAAERIKESKGLGSGLTLEVQRYINENYRHPITLNEIAAAINVNPSYLSRTFKNKTGAGIIETINRQRMEAAKELLSFRQAKVYEVAAAVGIEDTAYFSNLFRRYAGQSPKAYQDSHAGNG